MPAALTTGVAVVAPETMLPPLEAVQLKIAPGVVEEPLRVTWWRMQLSTWGRPALALASLKVPKLEGACKVF